MKLYKEVLIASAEQAEALPVGAVALQSWGHGTTARTLTNGRWITPSGAALPHAEVVGFTALVPIEAEEEWALIYEGQEPTPCADEADAREWAHIDGEGQAPSRRYTTTWEEA